MPIVRHDQVESYELHGNVMRGVATPNRGAQQLEVWQTTVAVGAATPPHVHAGEEVIVVLKGQGELHLSDQVAPFAGPCTLIAPANVPHQIVNTGTALLEAIAALPLGSVIATPDGQELELPWRR